MDTATEDTVEDTTATEEENKAEAERLEALLRQVEAESKLCDDPAWRNKQLRRLKIYNNQARDESKVGEPCRGSVRLRH